MASRLVIRNEFVVKENSHEKSRLSANNEDYQFTHGYFKLAIKILCFA
jgi:hypothetical protein